MRTGILLGWIWILGTVSSPGQRYLATFGVVSRLQVSRESSGLCAGDFNGDGVDDVATWGPNGLQVHIRVPSRSGWKSVEFQPAGTISSISAARLSGKRHDDLIVLTDHPPAISVVHTGRKGALVQEWSVPLHASFDSFRAADFTGDGYTDIALFGRKVLGVTVLEGTGHESFEHEQTILNDISVSGLASADINDDGLTDIIVANWVSNELLVMTSFGNLKFSEPASISFGGDPSLFSLAGGGTTDLAVVPAGSRRCEWFRGDPFGGFTAARTVPFDNDVSELALADLNGDGNNELCVLDRQAGSLQVYIPGAGEETRRVTFAGGESPFSFCFRRDDRKRLTEVLILGKGTGEVRVLHHSSEIEEPAAGTGMATGLKPGDVIVTDLDADGWNDALVANEGSPDLSVFLNNESGRMKGQIQLQAPAPMHGVHAVRSSDSTLILVGTTTDDRQLCMMEVNGGNLSARSWSLPVPDRVSLLSAIVDSSTRLLHLIGLEKEGGTTALMLYDQISSSRFVERSVRPKTITNILFASSADLNGDGIPDLLLVIPDSTPQVASIVALRGPISDTSRAALLIPSVQIPSRSTVMVWSVAVTRDTIPDIIVHIGSPLNELLVYAGLNDSVYATVPVRLKSPVGLLYPSDLSVVDMDLDGTNDLVILNRLNNSVEFWSGRGNGSFRPPVRLASGQEPGGFAIAPLKHDLVPQLLVTDKADGLLRLIDLQER